MKKTLLYILLVVSTALALCSCEQEVHVCSFDEGVVTAKPTCTSIGAKTRTCTVCGKTEVEVIQMLGHKEGSRETIEPTCTEKGGTFVRCEVCNEVLSKDEKPALGHDWDDGSITEKATCVSIGSLLRICRRCREEKVEVIPKTEHQAGSDETTPSTCTEKGRTEIRCTNCGEVLHSEAIPALGHVWETKERILEPTCETEGKEVWECSRCHQSEQRSVEPLGHSFTGKVETIDATCTAEGSRYGQCSRCDRAVHETIPKKDHTSGSWNVTKESSCTEKGHAERRCVVCDALLDEKDIEMLAHDFVDGEVTVEPTCISTGIQKTSCSVCGHEETKTLAVDPSNHKGATEYRHEGEPGWFTAVKEYGHCTDCGERISDEGRDLYMPITGYWESDPITYESMQMRMSASFVDGAVTLGQSLQGFCEESTFESYEVGTLRKTTGYDGDGNPVEEDVFGLIYTWSDGEYTEKSVMKFVSEDVASGTVCLYVSDSGEPLTFRQKTKQSHVHSYEAGATSWESLNEYGCVDMSLHYKETDCDSTIHDAFKVLDEHEYGDDGDCTVCGSARWYGMRWIHKVGDRRESVYFYAQNEAGFALPEPPEGFDCWRIYGQEYFITRDNGSFLAVHPTKDDEILITDIPVDTLIAENSVYMDDVASFEVVYEPAKSE